MMRVMRMNYQQEYIPHEYIELRFPAGTDVSGNGHRLNPNHLHILPRHSFIVLPNKDKKCSRARLSLKLRSWSN